MCFCEVLCSLDKSIKNLDGLTDELSTQEAKFHEHRSSNNIVTFTCTNNFRASPHC